MNHNTFRFKTNVGGVVAIGIISAAVVAVTMNAKYEKRKKDVEIYKIEAELRQRYADMKCTE